MHYQSAACPVPGALETEPLPAIPPADCDAGETLFAKPKITPRKRRLLIVDDEGIMRDGLCALLASETECDIVGVATSPRDAVRLAGTLRPELVIIDPASGAVSGAQTIAAFKRRLPEIRVLVLTFHKDDYSLEAALRAGADAYVLKNDTRSELLTAIRSLGDGKSYLSPSICDRVVDGYVKTQGPPHRRHTAAGALTDREREVIKLIARGYRTREIAEQLSLSHKTVEKHRSNLMRKLGLRSATAVAAYAIANGFLDR